MVQYTVEFGLIIFKCERMFVELNVLRQITAEHLMIIGEAIQIEEDLVRVDLVQLPGQRFLELVVHQKKERGFCSAPFIQFLRKVPGRVFQAKKWYYQTS